MSSSAKKLVNWRRNLTISGVSLRTRSSLLPNSSSRCAASAAAQSLPCAVQALLQGFQRNAMLVSRHGCLLMMIHDARLSVDIGAGLARARQQAEKVVGRDTLEWSLGLVTRDSPKGFVCSSSPRGLPASITLRDQKTTKHHHEQ
jgi:hypothetical protein